MVKITSTGKTQTRPVLIKLLVMSFVFFLLVLSCVYAEDQGLVLLLGAVDLIVVLPTMILLSVDASRLIRKENSKNREKRFLGAVLGLPQVFLGVALMAFGMAFPIVAIKEISVNISMGRSVLILIIQIFGALISLALGFYYLREGLGIKNGNNK